MDFKRVITETDVSGKNYIEMLSEAGTTYDIFKILKKLVHDYGYEKFVIFKLPQNNNVGIADIAIITNWDPELIKAYDAMSLLKDNPIIKSLNDSILPFHYTEDKVNFERGKELGKKVAELFADFNIYNGMYFPITDKGGGRGAFGLSGNRDKPSENEIKDLIYFSNYIYEKLTDIEGLPTNKSTKLTTREIECIYWTAAGKTSSEVALILELSENTINHYLSAAANKLNTVNKAHTVAKAIRLGILVI